MFLVANLVCRQQENIFCLQNSHNLKVTAIFNVNIFTEMVWSGIFSDDFESGRASSAQVYTKKAFCRVKNKF